MPRNPRAIRGPVVVPIDYDATSAVMTGFSNENGLWLVHYIRSFRLDEATHWWHGVQTTPVARSACGRETTWPVNISFDVDAAVAPTLYGPATAIREEILADYEADGYVPENYWIEEITQAEYDALPAALQTAQQEAALCLSCGGMVPNGRTRRTVPRAPDPTEGIEDLRLYLRRWNAAHS